MSHLRCAAVATVIAAPQFPQSQLQSTASSSAPLIHPETCCKVSSVARLSSSFQGTGKRSCHRQRGFYSHVAQVGILSKGARLDHLQVAIHDCSEMINRTQKGELWSKQGHFLSFVCRTGQAIISLHQGLFFSSCNFPPHQLNLGLLYHASVNRIFSFYLRLNKSGSHKMAPSYSKSNNRELAATLPSVICYSPL